MQGTPGTPIRETKLQSVCQQLVRLAYRLGPEAKLPTVRSLTESLPASVATINSALHELEARAILRRRHGVGIFVSAHLPRRRIVLLCRPRFFQEVGSSPFWGLLLEHVRRRAEQENEELRFLFTEEETLSLAQREALCAPAVDGVLGVGLEASAVEWIVAQGLPLVTFAGPGPCTVGFDSAEVHRRGTEILRARGCERIAVVPTDSDVHSKQESGYRWGKALLAQPRATWPQGILSPDDMRTLGLLGAFYQAGVPLDGPVRIATHANVGSPVLLGWESHLILLEVDPAHLVSLLFDLLESRVPGFHPIPITVRPGAQRP